MLEEKKTIFICRIIWSVLMVIGLLVPIFAIDEEETFVLAVCCIFADIFILIFLISSFLYSCKVYEYNGNVIVVYAGYSHHYIKVNGEKTDEYISSIFFTPIRLSCTLEDGTHLAATVSLVNRISLKINDRLYRAMETI